MDDIDEFEYHVKPPGPPLREMTVDDDNKDRLLKETFYIPYKLGAQVRQICRAKNVTMSLVYRQAAAKFIAENRDYLK